MLNRQTVERVLRNVRSGAQSEDKAAIAELCDEWLRSHAAQWKGKGKSPSIIMRCSDGKFIARILEEADGLGRPYMVRSNSNAIGGPVRTRREAEIIAETFAWAEGYFITNPRPATSPAPKPAT